MDFDDYIPLGIGARRVSLVQYPADAGNPSPDVVRAAIRPVAPDDCEDLVKRAAKQLEDQKPGGVIRIGRLNLLLHGDSWILASLDGEALDLVAAAMRSEDADLTDIALCCVPLEAGGRPCPGTVPDGGREGLRGRLVWSPALCTRCEACLQICPNQCLTLSSGCLGFDLDACIRCFKCVEVCPQGCLWPDARDALLCPALPGLAKWLATLGLPFEERYRRGAPPEYLQSPELRAMVADRPRPPRGKSLVILGLAVTTMQEHAAALVIDGKIAGYVEEERFRRSKHYGWHPPGRRGLTLCNDLSLGIEEAFCWRSVRKLLEMAGRRLEDVDYIAVNGIPARYRRSYSLNDSSRPPRILRSDKLIFVPHHLAHASSAFRPSGFSDAAVLTVDGRGDRETAAFFRATKDGQIVPVFDVLSGEDSSIGGVYETITRILGFGRFGQGSTMALAPFGEPAFDLSACLSVERHDRHSIHEHRAYEAFRRFSRSRWSVLTGEHRNLAASVQAALEESVFRLLEEGFAGCPPGNLCLSGGVALNCRMNQRIRERFQPADMFIQPAAHDGGTALGAALEAHRFVSGENPECGAMRHAFLGPEYDNRDIEEVLARFGVAFTRSGHVARDAAQLIADGKVVCWFQGRLEAGPRALGARSILADPRRGELKERLNRIKSREPWRPFAPSVLAGREGEIFEDAFDAPFMLYTLTVKPDLRERIPLVMHVDGTTRPQSVDAAAHPRYHALLEHFAALSGLPLVVNTSFNTGYEPIVCSPTDALASFLMLGADHLAIGDFIVSR